MGWKYTQPIVFSYFIFYATKMTARSKSKSTTQDDEDDTAATMVAVCAPEAPVEMLIGQIMKTKTTTNTTTKQQQ